MTTTHSRADALTDLLPCPFCGGTDLEIANTHTPSFWVRCNECDAEATGERFPTPTGTVRENRFHYSPTPDDTGFEATFENLHPEYQEAFRSAVNAWNRRTSVEQPAAPIDGIEELRDKWKLVDGDMREGAHGLITYHVEAFDEGVRAGGSKPAPSPADERAAFPRYTEWLHLRMHGEWSSGVPAWARDHTGRMNDFTAASAVIEELAAARASSANETGAEGATWYDRWQAECTRDHGEYDENAPIADRLRWWVPKSARHGTILLEDDLREAADDLSRSPAQADARVGLTDEQRGAISSGIAALERLGWTGPAGILRALLAAHPGQPEPIDMLLFCPKCGVQHVDGVEDHEVDHGSHVEVVADWMNPPHRSHLCHACGTIWRPADVPTNGVAAIATRGNADTWSGQPVPRAEVVPTMRPYPDELTADLRHVLGFPNFRCGPYAHLMRAAGADIKAKAEDEQAYVLHYLVKMVLDHGARWADVAGDELEAMRDKVSAAAAGGDHANG